MKKKKVLLVDDQPSFLKAGNNILSKKGFDVIIADNGEKAIEIFKARIFDLIILDYYMPMMNGLEVLKKMRANPDLTRCDSPVLILSSEENPEIQKKLDENGANDFLHKKRLTSSPEIFLEKVYTLTNQFKEAAPYKKVKLSKTIPSIVKKFHVFTSRIIQGYLASKTVELKEIEKSFNFLLNEIEKGEVYGLVYDLVTPNDYLVTHTVNSTLLTMMFCHKTLNWEREKVMNAAVGAFFHDFGYLGSQKPLFCSPSTLSMDDYLHYLGHVERSVAIAKRVGLTQESIEYISTHHERIDGSGFPHHKEVEKFTEIGKIAAIINSFDSLTFANNFHGKYRSADAIERMTMWENNFCEEYLQSFAAFIKEFDIKPHD